MFDIGWSEMAIIAFVALLVLGPKELPQAMRQFAQFSKKMRRYAQEFRSGVDNIVREAELEDAKKALDTVRTANPKTALKKMVDPTGEMTDEVKSIETAAKDGTGKTVAAAVPAAARRPLPPGEPQADPSGPALPPPAVPAAVQAEAIVAEPAVARRVTTPLQVAPAHSIRPPIEPAKVDAAKIETPKVEPPKIETPKVEIAKAETARAEPATEQDGPQAPDLRKQA